MEWEIDATGRQTDPLVCRLFRLDRRRDPRRRRRHAMRRGRASESECASAFPARVPGVLPARVPRAPGGCPATSRRRSRRVPRALPARAPSWSGAGRWIALRPRQTRESGRRFDGLAGRSAGRDGAVRGVTEALRRRYVSSRASRPISPGSCDFAGSKIVKTVTNMFHVEHCNSRGAARRVVEMRKGDGRGGGRYSVTKAACRPEQVR